MPSRVKAVSHEDQLSLVEHLDELRVPHRRLHRRLRRRPGALLLAEPPAAGNRRRAAPRGSQEAAHLRHHRALHDHDHGRRLRRPDPGDAVPALPALRLRAAGLQPRRAPDRAADPAALPDPLPGRDRLRLLRGDAGGGQVPAQLQRQPVQRPGPRPRLLQLLLDDDARGRPDLPAAAGDPRGHPARNRQGRAAALQPPLRLPADRDRRRGAARSRPCLDAHRDGSAACSV